jgi:hypothetical protein
MKFIITESQGKSIDNMIQRMIDSTLDIIKEESDDWGMGEMDELDEVSSVDKIVVDRVVTINKIKVYVNIYKNSNREDFDNLRAEIQYRLEDWFPNIELYIENIIDDRKFGPGIDW